MKIIMSNILVCFYFTGNTNRILTKISHIPTWLRNLFSHFCVTCHFLPLVPCRWFWNEDGLLCCVQFILYNGRIFSSLFCVGLRRKFAHLFLLLLLNEACVLHSPFLNKYTHICVYVVAIKDKTLVLAF